MPFDIELQQKVVIFLGADSSMDLSVLRILLVVICRSLQLNSYLQTAPLSGGVGGGWGVGGFHGALGPRACPPRSAANMHIHMARHACG